MSHLSPIVALLAASIVWCPTPVHSLMNATIGVTIKVTLSNYSNPHQVLADTGVACDAGTNCDPYFVVQLGTYRHSFQHEKRSDVFRNRYNMSGEFYTAEFPLSQEIPETLVIGVSVMDEDSLLDPAAYQVIARPSFVELDRLLPSFPGAGDRSSNAIWRSVEWTPDNRYVRFALKVEAFCWPGLYGKACGHRCDGEVVATYPTCDLVGDASCRNSGAALIDCKAAAAAVGGGGSRSAGASTAGQENSWQKWFTSKYMIIGLVSVVAATLLIAAVASLVVVRRKRRARELLSDEYKLSITRQVSVQVQQQQQQQQQQQHTLSTSLESSAPSRLGSHSFKNPVYTGAAAQHQQLQLHQHQQQQHQSLGSAATDQGSGGGTCTADEVYEDIEEQQVGGEQPPLLPPRVETLAGQRSQ